MRTRRAALFLFAALTACGGGTSVRLEAARSIENTTAAAHEPAPEERLLDLWFELFTRLLPVWDDTGNAWRRQHATDAQLAAIAALERDSSELLERAAPILAELEVPRCARMVPALAALPAGRYEPAQWSAFDPSAEFSLRAEAIEQFFAETIAGLGRVCLYARLRAAGQWSIAVRHYETRDGREAALAAPDGEALRADLERLDELERNLGELASSRRGTLSHAQIEATFRSVRDGSVEVLSRWAPDDPGVARIARLDLDRTWDDRTVAAVFQELDARIWRMRTELGRARMPAVQGRSEDARLARAVLDVLVESDEAAARAARTPGLPELRMYWPAPELSELAALCDGEAPEPLDEFEPSWRRPLEDHSCARRDLDAEALMDAARAMDHESNGLGRDIASTSVGLLYGDACALGDATGCIRYGLFLADAPPPFRDEARAVEILTAQCSDVSTSEEEITACERLGRLRVGHDPGNE